MLRNRKQKMNERFSLYLKEIGLLNKALSSLIVKKKSNINGKNFIDLSFNLLMDYFNNIKEEQIKYMSHWIPTNFIKITEKIKKSKIKSIYLQKRLRNKIILLKYFFIWKININIFRNKKDLHLGEYADNVRLYKLINIDNNIDVDNKNITQTEENEKNKELNENEKSISFITNNVNINHYNDKTNNNTSKNKDNTSFNKKFDKNENKPNKNIINNNNKKKFNINPNNLKFMNKHIKQIKINKVKTNKQAHLLTSLEEKEKIELKECNFHPKINNIKKLLRNNSLKQNSKNASLNNRRKSKEIQSRFEKLYNDKEKYAISKDLKIKEFEKIVSKNVTFAPKIKKIRKYKSVGNFKKRQEKYLLNKNKHSTEVKNEIDLLYDSICSFNPKITNEKGKLYKIRNKEKIKKPVYLRLYKEGEIRQNNLIRQEIETINEIIELSNIINPEKTFDFSTINRLYENKEKINIMNKTIKKVEKDEGTTFKPFIYENPYSKSVNTSFYERNQKFMEDKKSFIEENKNQMDKSLINKKYTKEERQAIVSNIIKRLYNNRFSQVNGNINKS